MRTLDRRWQPLLGQVRDGRDLGWRSEEVSVDLAAPGVLVGRPTARRRPTS